VWSQIYNKGLSVTLANIGQGGEIRSAARRAASGGHGVKRGNRAFNGFQGLAAIGIQIGDSVEATVV